MSDNSQVQHTVLNFLEQFPSIELPFAEYLAMLPPLRIRLYSISSSPLSDPSVCTITYGVLNASGPPGQTSARHIGVASNYLSTLSPKDSVKFSLLPSKSGFSLPPIGSNSPTPIIMICAGTGLAPFRGFVQERSLQMGGKSGVKLAPALLFVGCRSAIGDRLYAQQMDAWQDEGVVEIRYAFSKEKEKSDGCRYVQDRILKDGAKVKELWGKDAKVYICGASLLVKEVGNALRTVLFESTSDKERDNLFLEAKKNGRILQDVFG
jgi:cytochrome P450 / NADPH-cytochrome P450 reductase